MDDEEEVGGTTDESEDGEAEYEFEGYKVEFNERVALTPPAAISTRG